MLHRLHKLFKQEVQAIEKPSFSHILNTLACKDTHTWLHIHIFSLKATCLTWSYLPVKCYDCNINKMECREGGLSPVVTWVFPDMKVCVYECVCFLFPTPSHAKKKQNPALPCFAPLQSDFIPVHMSYFVEPSHLTRHHPPHLPQQTHCHLE